MKNPYRQASFWFSVDSLAQLPADTGLEIAFAGRSNSGKSSAINAITEQTSLARISKTPGRTQQINFFRLDDAHRLVDLPGYGYAKVSEELKRKWQNTVEGYLNGRDSLVGILLTMDIRHPMKTFDEQMVAWCAQVNMPLHILLTKSDKLNRMGVTEAVRAVRKQLQTYPGEMSVQAFSALKKIGVEEAITVLNRWLDLETAQPQ